MTEAISRIWKRLTLTVDIWGLSWFILIIGVGVMFIMHETFVVERANRIEVAKILAGCDK